MIFYLAKDTATKSIVLYMESIGNARNFLSAARECSLTKPIIVACSMFELFCVCLRLRPSHIPSQIIVEEY